MKFLRIYFSACILLLSFVQFTNAQIDVSWIGGSSNSWNDAANWSPAGVPGVNDTAFITLDGDYTVTLDADAAVSKIVLGGTTGTQTLSLANSTLTMSGNIEVGANGALSVNSGTIAGTGTIINNGTLGSIQGTFNVALDNYGLSNFAGTSQLTDTIITHANSTLQVASYSNVAIGFTSTRGFTNNGLLECLTYNYWAGGTMEITNGSLVNSPGAVFNILAPGTLSSSASPLYLTVQLENSGEVFFDHAVIFNKTDAAHVNNGQLEIQGHTVSLNQTGTDPGFSNSGTITIDQNSTLAITGGSFDYNAGPLDVQGLISFTNATVNVIPAYTNTIHMSLNGSTINCSSTFINQEELSMLNSIVNGDHAFTNQDTLLATGCEFNMDFTNEDAATFAGSTTLNDTLITTPGSTLNITSYSNGAIQFTSASGFTNHGLLDSRTYNYHAGGFISITDGTLINESQGVVAISAPAALSSAASALRLLLQLDNQGEFTIDHLTTLDRMDAIHTNSGSLRVTNRNFTINLDGTSPAFINTGDLHIETPSTLTVIGGAFDHLSGTFDLQGAFSATSSTVTLVPEFTNNSSVYLSAVILNCSAPFTNNSDLEIINSTVNGDYFFTNQDTMSANGIILNMDFDNQGMASFTGAMDMNDTLITHPNTTLNIMSSSYMDFTSDMGITNHGLMQIITRNYWAGGTMEVVNGSLTNTAGAVMNIITQGSISGSSSPLTLSLHLVNHGELLVDHNVNLSRASVTHENSGVFTLTNHVLTINQAGTSFINQAGGSMFGIGTISLTGVSFTNSGAINPGMSPGLLTINGDVVQDPSSALNVELGGLTAGTLHDRLSVSGAYEIEGRLNVELIDGFNPTAGDIFEVAAFASSTGEYDETNLPYPGTGVIFSVVQNPTNVSVEAVAHANNSPFVDSQIADVLLDEDFGTMLVADLDTVFDDLDIPLGDELVYSFELLDNIVEASMTDNTLSLNSIPDANGTSSIIVTATDAGQETARDTVQIQVNAVNDAPGSFALDVPADGASIPAHADLIFSWHAAGDIDGDAIEYSLSISTASWDSVITEIADTFLVFSDLSLLEEDVSHQWSVSATDGTAVTSCDQDFSFTTPNTTSIHSSIAENDLQLKQNYPNPFSDYTHIDFSLPASSIVSIQIFDLHGGLIKTLDAGQLPGGHHSFRLDLDELANGIYFYRLNVGPDSMIKKMTKTE